MSQPAPAVLRALLVDDEPAARQLLQDLLRELPGIEVVGSCRNGREASQWLASQRADLLFLDIEMPGMDGFEVVASLAPDSPMAPRPAVIFVTAYDDYAIRAFEAEAWDYLLKPFDGERLRQAVERARRRLERQRATPSATPDAPKPEVPGEGPPLERLAVPHGRGRVTLRLSEVLWIQAESNYVRFHLPQASYLARMSLTRLESRLDPRRFVRVHRSAIVNVEQIDRLDPRGHGDMSLTLKDGRRVAMSRRYRERFEQVLESLP